MNIKIRAMDIKTNRLTTLIGVIGIIIILFLFSIFVISGCTDTLKGQMNPNKRPIVSFVNIPPDSSNFSRNPQVYWVGSDIDGQIDYYRYYVAKASQVGSDPLSFIQTVGDSMWTYMDVDLSASDPKTTGTIPLKANLNDPVNSYVPQYIFLQAFDNDGNASDIAYRILNRNDNPPDTRIAYIDTSRPFVNSVFSGGIITGVQVNWEGSDRKDYEELGLIPPPFDFQWRLYGPYTTQELGDIDSSFIKKVFVTEDARMFYVGDTLIQCDTLSVLDTNINGIDTSIFVDSCDTIIFTDATTATPFYHPDSLFMVNDSSFINSSYNKLVDTSSNGIDSWIQKTSDTIYNVYRYDQTDTTVQKYFIFWLRTRDDAFVSDITPAFIKFSVINPKYERDVALLDFSSTGGTNVNSYVKQDTAKAFWYNLIHNWKPNVVFDTSYFQANVYTRGDAHRSGIDYVRPVKYGYDAPLKLLLQHKVLILYKESTNNSTKTVKSGVSNIYTAIDAGINAWATWRDPFGGDAQPDKGDDFHIKTHIVPPLYTAYFGVVKLIDSRWFQSAFRFNIDSGGVYLAKRVEDFKGAYSLDESQWPTLDVDTALLHQRLHWPDGPPFDTLFIWIDSIASLPAVNWSVRSYGTEPMYLYKSLYGANHPLGADFSFEGSPVGIRYKTSLYKTVHFNFTPMVIDTSQMQELADNVLDWLYNPNLSSAKISDNRYPDAKVKISVSEARQRYWQRREEETKEKLESLGK